MGTGDWVNLCAPDRSGKREHGHGTHSWLESRQGVQSCGHMRDKPFSRASVETRLLSETKCYCGNVSYLPVWNELLSSDCPAINERNLLLWRLLNLIFYFNTKLLLKYTYKPLMNHDSKLTNFMHFLVSLLWRICHLSSLMGFTGMWSHGLNLVKFTAGKHTNGLKLMVDSQCLSPPETAGIDYDCWIWLWISIMYWWNVHTVP